MFVFSDSAQQAACAPAPAPALPAPPVVVLADLSSQGMNAAWRGALVARDRGLPLRLVHRHGASPASLLDRRSLQHLARDIQRVLRLQVSCEPDAPQASLAGASLIVLPHGEPRSLLDWVRGCPAQRLALRFERPVLVVRRPALSSYRRVMASIALAPEAERLIDAGRQLSRDPRMTVFHVMPTRDEEIMRMTGVPPRVVRDVLELALANARLRISTLIDKAGAGGDGLVPHVDRGEATERILGQERASDSELLVLGSTVRPWARLFASVGTSSRVLRASRSDVLLVPLHPQPASSVWPTLRSPEKLRSREAS